MYTKKEEVLPFINIAAHFDENTLVTKKGELLRIIRVYGFEKKDELYGTQNLRDVLRSTINREVKNSEIAVYVYVKRENTNMMPQGDFYPGIASDVNSYWQKYHTWDKQLMNVLYILFVHSAQNINQFDYKNLFSNFFKNKYKNELNVKNNILIDICNRVNKNLNRFGSEILTIKITENSAISEPLSFFYYLVHLEEKDIELDTYDLSYLVSEPEFHYEFNHAVLKTPNGNNKFYAIYTFKDLGNITIDSADALLQLEGKFLITECFSYIPTKLGRDKFMNKRIFISEDFLKLNIGAMGEVMEGYQDNYDYCKHSMSILIYGDVLEEFNRNATKLKEAAESKGFAIFREDLNLAKSFWSRIPGNMDFMRKSSVFLVDKVALFSSIHQRTLGSYVGSVWGGPISIFKNINGYPFYFNFHDKNGVGHTILIGEDTYLSIIVKRFLVAQSMRMRVKQIYISTNLTSKDFIVSLGGHSIQIKEDEVSQIKVNIFHPDVFKNKELTLELLAKTLLKDEQINEGNIRLLQKIIEELYQNHPSGTDYLNVLTVAIENLNNSTIKNNFQDFIKSSIYQNLFNEDKFDFLLSSDVLNIDLSQFVDNQYFSVFLTALVYRIADYIPMGPFIICSDSGKYFFSYGDAKQGFENLLSNITSKNGILFLSVVHQEEWLSNEEFKSMYRYFASKIFLPRRLADKEYQHTYSLTSEELNKLKAGDIDGGYFLIKQDMYSVLANIEIDPDSSIYPVLAR